MADGESRDVPCPTSLNARFYHYRPVEYEGYEFLSVWQSTLTSYPLPSWNWYHATPNRDIVSVDGKARWEGAAIQVHCWVYRAMYVLVRHYDPVAGAGRLVKLCESGGGSGSTLFRREDDGSDGREDYKIIDDPYAEPYDPYESSWGYDEFCSGGDGGGDGDSGSGTQYAPGDNTGGETVDWGTGTGNGGTSACGATAVVEYICIDVWVDGSWVEWSCGFATTC